MSARPPSSIALPSHKRTTGPTSSSSSYSHSGSTSGRAHAPRRSTTSSSDPAASFGSSQWSGSAADSQSRPMTGRSYASERTSGMGSEAGSVFLMSTLNSNTPQYRILSIVSSKTFSNLILLIIIANTALMALQSTGMNANYDFIIVIISVISFLMPYLVAASSFGINTNILRLLRIMRAFRALRSLRVLRTISILRSLQTIVSTLLRSLSALSNIVALMGLILYIFAVIARSTYGTVDTWRFQSMGTTMFRLFAVLTMDDWSTIYLDNMHRPGGGQGLAILLILFMVIEAFVLLNLFVAVIVNNLAHNHSAMPTPRPGGGGGGGYGARPTTGVPPPLPPSSGGAGGNGSAENLGNGGGDPNTFGPGNGAVADTTSSTAVHSLWESAGDSVGTIDWFYPPAMPLTRKELVATYFRQIALLEHTARATGRQWKVLDDLVNLTREGGDGSGRGGGGSGGFGGGGS
ncbi:Ion transport protein-domain-containing protein [Blastocladiella britannica]|nr:Ion transport protein-domain-containing protein [Blastocladiella britannica]